MEQGGESISNDVQFLTTKKRRKTTTFKFHS